jgi:hypothetical protein
MLETVARSDDGTRITPQRLKVEAGFAADPTRETFGARKRIPVPLFNGPSISFHE